MSGLTLSGTIFVLTLGGILLGTLLRRALPKHHLSEATKDAVRLGVGLIATTLNVTVITCLFLFAVSAACAIFLILQLSRLFTGLMSISSALLRNALGTL